MRMQAMVLAFYLLDTLLMALYAVQGVLPAAAALAFGAAGCGITVLFAIAANLGVHRRLGTVAFTALQVLSATCLMLVTAAALPQIGVLLLFTVIVAVATAALQLPLRAVVAVTALIAAGTLAILLLHGERLGLPLDGIGLRLVSGLWFAIVVAKIGVISLIGTRMREALAASNARLAEALTQVRELSERDELTGLRNRRSILALLSDERARFARGGLPFGVALLDIDHFKQVNDRFGHATGDEVLRHFAQIVAVNLRSTDRIARYGGEEFLLLLPNTGDVRLAVRAAERHRKAVERFDWTPLAPDLRITCSIGVTVSRAGESVADLLERADTCLYRAKAAGRNAVCAD